jgi:hypothetical protein
MACLLGIPDGYVLICSFAPLGYDHTVLLEPDPRAAYAWLTLPYL